VRQAAQHRGSKPSRRHDYRRCAFASGSAWQVLFAKGIWADGFEKLQLVPLLIVTPLTFLGGSFYSIDMLPPVWRTITLANPVVYLVSGFRWSFYGSSDVSVGVSLSMTMAFLILCLATVWWIFKTGYRLRT
jgi:ABC-2 type transport system permease protein